MQTFIKFLYSLFIAGALVAFVGFGTLAIYQQPKEPEYPTSTYDYSYDYDYESPAAQQTQRDYDKAYETFQDDEKNYLRNITIIALASVPVLVIVGIILFRKSDVISEGLVLGGAGVSIYAANIARATDKPVLGFAAAILLLASLLLITYVRFSVITKKTKHS